MTQCKACQANQTKHGYPRPFFTLTLDLLRIVAQADATRDEVRHELAHRSSKGAQRLLEELGGPNAARVQPSTQPEDLSLVAERSLRSRWYKNHRYMQRIHDQPGSAEFLKRTRETNAAIEREWVRRREYPHVPDYWCSTNERVLGSSVVPDYGVLSALGYSVASTARLTDDQRLWLLDAIIAAELPPIANRNYLESWGAPLSARRLEKTLHTLRGLASMALRVKPLHRAREKWLIDARYLESNWTVEGGG
ncbi:MAG: hypothetical protein ACK4YM_04925 [Novosphingobium sp.]